MEVMCRDRFGHFPAHVFSLWTCSFCYMYLFNSRTQLTINFNRTHPRIVDPATETQFLPDVINGTAREQICDFLSDADCGRWVSCCQDAIGCCEEQASAGYMNASSEDLDSEENNCPATWDGYSCFEATSAGTQALVTCPSFILPSVDPGAAQGKVSKECMATGRWFQQHNLEWTDYTSCYN